MSGADDDARIDAAAHHAVERAEAAKTRRRWVTLAEVVGLAGVVIAALSLWLTWSQRRTDEADRAAEQATTARAKTVIRFEGAATHDGDALTLVDPDHKVDTIDVRLPAALGGTHEGIADARIAADWFAAPLLKLTDGGADRRSGRLPVLVTANWWDVERQRHDRAIYDVLWTTEPHWLHGRTVKLTGLVLRERGGTPARVEAIWTTEKPR